MNFLSKKAEFLLIVGMLLSGFLANAQGDKIPTISIQTNADTIGEDSELKFTITLENANDFDIQKPIFEDFEVVGGPMQSNQTTVINGEMSSKQSLTYYLKPKQKGAFLIEPATAAKGNEQLRTDYYPIWVVTEGTQPAPKVQERERSRNGFFFEFGGDGFKAPSSPTPPTPPKKKRKIYKL